MISDIGALALDISFGEFLWSLLIIFFMLTFLVILFQVAVDIFRSDDLSGWGKALWIIFLIVLPFLGLLIYLIVRGTGMAKRQRTEALEARADFDDYVRSVAGGPAGEIAKAKELLDSGAITQAEFDALKARLLA